VESILEDECTKSLVKSGEAFLRDNRHIAVDYAIIASDYRNDFEARVSVVNNRPGTLKYVYFLSVLISLDPKWFRSNKCI